MSQTVTNRVFTPNGKVYVTDDQYGDDRLIELFNKYGNLKMQACYKEFGKSLDEMTAFWTGTIKEFYE